MDVGNYEIMPIQNVELTAVADKLVGILKRYDLESISMTIIAGVDEEQPFICIRTVDKNGRCDALTTTWEDGE